MLLSGRSLFRAHNDLVAEKAPEESVTFPELLGRSGYMTFATGKWHNSRRLFARSFKDGGNIFFGGMSDHSRVPVCDYDRSGEYPKERAHAGERFSSELFTDSAVRFLDTYRGQDPFLLYVAYTAPHDPRMPPKEFAYSPDAVSLPRNFLPEHPFDNGEMKVRDEQLAPWPRTPEVVRQHIADYYGMITHLDSQIGRVLRALEETGRASETYVVFAGDNGLAIGSHGLLGKQNLYEHSVRVPLIVRGPGIARGRRNDGGLYLYDLYPAICEWAGVQPPEAVEGRGLNAGRDSMFFAYRHLQRAVRAGGWKLIRYRTGPTQLFDLRSDPWELKNLAGARSAVLRRMNAALQDWMRRTGDPEAVEFSRETP